MTQRSPIRCQFADIPIVMTNLQQNGFQTNENGMTA